MAGRRLLLVLMVSFATGTLAETSSTGFRMLNPKWDEMFWPLTIAVWVLTTALVKLGLTWVKPYAGGLPESAMQILVGVALAVAFTAVGLDVRVFAFDSHVFFAFLLAPIIFDAGYFMPNKSFFDRCDVIALFAVVGTVFNAFAIGGSLAVMNSFDLFTVRSSTSEMFLFASLISAVDPVAVIAVFEELHVNKQLFVTVFGEALFNDAISVVLYGICKSFAVASGSMGAFDFGLAVVGFFVVAVGGIFIGLASAFLTALTTRIAANSPVVVPILALVVPYIGYVASEIISFSSIIAAAVCGMAMKQYVKANVDYCTYATINSNTRILAICAEIATFMLLGLATVSVEHHWDTTFVCATIFFCLVYRVVAIVGLSLLLKLVKGTQISKTDQTVICCGGLRGPIAFGLVVSMPASVVGRPMFSTATLAIIFFSVGIQGLAMRPLLKWLDVKTDDHGPESSTDVMYKKSVDYMMAGVETIYGTNGRQSFNLWFEVLNARFLRPILTREPPRDRDATKIVRAFHRGTILTAIDLCGRREQQV